VRARKQPSGAQKRKRAKERAALLGVLMPPAPKALTSLTAVKAEASRNYRDWKAGRIPHELYIVSFRGLSSLASIMQAGEVERQREIDEQLLRSLEAMEARQAGMPLVELTHTGPALVGELMPRESSDDNVPRGTPDSDDEVNS
jgi:hypothetical protein